MAPSSVSTTIQHQLKQTIEAAINSKGGFQSAFDARLLAAETIRDLHNSWATCLPRRSRCNQQADSTVDKIALFYTAGQKLRPYRDLPDALPTKIIACFTTPIQQKREITANFLKKILKGASIAHMAETKKMDDMEAAEASTPTETQKAQDLAGNNTTISAGGDVAEKDAQFQEDAKEDSKATTAANSSSMSQQSGKAPAKDGQKADPSSTGREHNTKWYPDEEQFMRDLITNHLDWTWAQYAAENTAKFKGTYYTGPANEPHWGQREGRTGNAVRLRFMSFKKGLREAAQGGAAAGSSTAPGVTASAAPASGSSTQGATTGDQAGGEDGCNGEAAPSTGEVSGGTTGAGNTSSPPAKVIYVSGKVVGRPAPRGMNEGDAAAPAEGVAATSSSANNADGGAAAEDEVEEDEDPVGDLTEMVARVEAGDL